MIGFEVDHQKIALACIDAAVALYLSSGDGEHRLENEWFKVSTRFLAVDFDFVSIEIVPGQEYDNDLTTSTCSRELKKLFNLLVVLN